MQSSEIRLERTEIATQDYLSGIEPSIDEDGHNNSHQRRRIIICCDGTWNDRETNQPLTNVTRIQSCLDVRDKRRKEQYEQLSYYIDGIGSGTTWGGAIHDGSTESGNKRKIREAYRHLCLTYTDGDEIILIGFSRGAFTIRCLASLINDVGLLDGILLNQELPAIFKLWRNQDNSNQHDHQNDEDDEKLSHLEKHCRELIEKYRGLEKTILRRKIRIRACAVWDTVKSLGFPWPKRVPHKKSKQYNFINDRLTPNIDNAFQALSLDERRWHFRPAVWSNSQQGPALKQCWFLGSHSDIGGGYHNTGFANITLLWMISQLEPFVKFDEKAIWNSTEDGKILGVNVAEIDNIHRHTRRGFWKLGGSKTREVGIYRTPCDKQRSSLGKPSPKTSEHALGSNASIHFSVRLLSEIYPLRGRKRCRALKKSVIQESIKEGVIWHRKGFSNMKDIPQEDIPQDDAGDNEQAMLHRWLDRDIAAREIFGGQKASEAIVGSVLHTAEGKIPSIDRRRPFPLPSTAVVL